MRIARYASALVTAAAVVVPSVAAAQAAPTDTPNAPPPAPVFRVRSRFAVGGYNGGLLAPAFAPAPGLYVRAGAQLTERVGLDGQLTLTSLIFYGFAGLSAVVDVSITDWFALGTGLGAHLAYALGGSFASGAAMFVGVPLRVAFRIGRRSAATRRRHALELFWQSDIGPSFTDNGVGFLVTGFLGVGYVMY